MFNINRNRLAFCSIALAALVLVWACPAKAADDCKGKVVGFPIRVEGAESGLSQTATATYGGRITVRVDVSPCPKPPAAPATQSPGNPDQAPSPSNAKPAEPSSDQKKDQTSQDGQSWIPGLRHSDILKLVPYLDARPLKGIYPESIDPHNHLLTYHLARTEGSKEAWSDLLSNPGFDPRVMSFSVGLEDKEQLQTSATLSLIVIRKQWLMLAIVIFLIVLYIFFRLAARTALLRDGGTGAGVMSGFSVLWRRSPKDPNLPPFSLARTQMSFWFFMVIAAFVLIWLVIGDTDTITQGVLVLIGISAGTALGATAIDSSKGDPSAPRPAETSKGFLNDILSDTTGISFHRFQIVVWTIVLGFIFVRHVLNHLAMPEFSTNLLTLMGISSGTYLGMKLPDKASPAPSK
jgi:hypothetical protein